ncbi:MAG TPA: hypothetical protein VKA84_20855 [Gemmatimonadaceae bacterium]|nr:hypothetical protein [Gemmatimonadaceae bacterium]
MTAGLPGAGIGGLFYLLSALLMPVRSLHRALTGGEPRWRLALRQAALAAGVLGGIWATGWLLGVVVKHAGAAAALGTAGRPDAPNVVRTGALLFSFGTLAAVLAAVQLARLAVGRRAPAAPGLAPTILAAAARTAPAVRVVSHPRRESPSGAWRRVPRPTPFPRRDSGQFAKVGG